MTSHAATLDRSAPPTPDRRTWWREVLAGTALVVADLVAFAWIMAHQVRVFSHQHDDVGRNVNFFLGSDLSQPVQLWVWLLVAGNGLLLSLRRSTRRAGMAVLLASAVVAVFVAGSWGIALLQLMAE